MYNQPLKMNASVAAPLPHLPNSRLTTRKSQQNFAFQPTTRKSHFPGTHFQCLDLSVNRKQNFAFQPEELVFSGQSTTRKLNRCNKASFFDGLLTEPLPNFKSPSELIMHFYQSLNDKSLNRLDMYFSSDCIVEDSAFVEPFQGVKDSANYLRSLTKAMGDNVKFVIDRVYDDDDLTAATTWHLEWAGDIIPFTRGCSFFVFQKDNERLHIRKAFFIVESPFKPGYIALELLNLVSFSFDKFPTFAKWIIKNWYGIFNFMLKAYRTYLEPFILPLVFYYTGTWTYAVSVMKGPLEVLLKLLRMLFMKS